MATTPEPCAPFELVRAHPSFIVPPFDASMRKLTPEEILWYKERGCNVDENGDTLEPEGGLVSCGVGRFHPNADVIAREKAAKAKAAAEAEEKGYDDEEHRELHAKIFGSDSEEEDEDEAEDDEVVEVLDGVAVSADAKESYDPDKIFTVERILKDKTVKGQKRYLVKWAGYDASYNSWEPPECFVDDSPITIYENNKPRKEKKRKEIVAQPKTQEDVDAAFARELHEQDRRVRKKPTRVEPQFGKSNVPVKYI